MKKRQIEAQNMYQALLNVMILFKANWASNTDLSNLVAIFTNMLGLLNLAGTNQKNITKGITQTKAQARSALIQMALAHSAAGIAYAASIGNIALKINSKLVESKLNKATDVALADICQSIYNLVNPYAAGLTNFGANVATLTAFQAAITAYQPLSQQPVNARAAKKSATLNVSAQIGAIDILVKEQLDSFMVQFKLAVPEFYNQYMGLRHTAHTNRHLKTVSLAIAVTTGAAKALEYAEIKLVDTRGTKRDKFSKADGSQHFTRLKPDTFTITVTIPGYVSQTQTITVNAPQKLNVNFVLVTSTGGRANPQ
jgi:hypothetical protein